MSNEIRKLYKSRTNRMIDGVCGGAAEFFNLDPTLVRIAWVMLTFFGGSGILLYIISMIIMPVNPALSGSSAQVSGVSSPTNHRFWGILLVVIGGIWLMSNLGMWHHWWGFSWDLLFPTVLILAGVAFLFGGRNYITNQQSQVGSEEGATIGSDPTPHVSKLYRSRTERKMFGVCGGLGMHFGVDPTIVRVLFVVSAFASFGLTIVAYILMAIIVPDEPFIFTTRGA